jgi:membrane-associated protease RseP (regulator of RpoE activity)
LRGSLDEVTLLVRRGAEEIRVTGRWPAAESVLDRRGLVLAGAMFADAGVMARGHLAPEYALMVHSVEPGSEAEVLEVRPYDVLVSADGAPVPSLDALARLVARSRREGRPVQLMLLRFAPENSVQLFEFHGRALPVEGTAWVRPGRP